MPLAIINVEQTANDRWHAEIETGGHNCRRAVINKTSFADIMAAVIDAYLGFMPPPAPVEKPKPAEEWRQPEPSEPVQRRPYVRRA